MNENEQAFSLKSLFVPLTTLKAIHIIVIVGFIIYFNVLFGELIGDDFSQIANNPYIRSLSNIFFPFANPLDGVVNAFRFYRPLVYVIYTLVYSMSGSTTFFYHLLSISLHITNAILIFLLFKSFFRKEYALILAIVFLVHPINVEAVSFISSLQDVLYLFFGLLAFYTFKSREKSTFKHIGVICLFIILSLLSKESGVLFIPMVILYGYLFKDKRLFKSSIIISAISLSSYAFLRFVIAKHYYAAHAAVTSQIIATELMNVPKMIFYYIKTFIFPRELSIAQLWLVNSTSVKDFYLPLASDIIVAILIISLGIFILKRKRDQFPIFIFFLTWIVLGIIPHLQIWALDATVADRWFYFPMVGLLGILGLTATNIMTSNKKINLLIYTLIAVFIISLSIRTIVRNIDWQTRLGLYKHDAPIANNIVLERLLEEEYIRLGDLQSAKKQLSKIKSLYPDDSISWWYDGLINFQSGNFDQARGSLMKLLDTPNEQLAYLLLPQILINHDQNYKNAHELLSRGVKKYPQNLGLWKSLAFVEFKLGNLKEASQAAQKANASVDAIISENSK